MGAEGDGAAAMLPYEAEQEQKYMPLAQARKGAAIYSMLKRGERVMLVAGGAAASYIHAAALRERRCCYARRRYAMKALCCQRYGAVAAAMLASALPALRLRRVLL